MKIWCTKCEGERTAAKVRRPPRGTQKSTTTVNVCLTCAKEYGAPPGPPGVRIYRRQLRRLGQLEMF